MNPSSSLFTHLFKRVLDHTYPEDNDGVARIRFNELKRKAEKHRVRKYIAGVLSIFASLRTDPTGTPLD